MVVEQQAVVCTEWDIACPGRLNRMMRSIARAKKSRPRSVGSPPCQAMLPRRSGAFRAIGGYRIPASPRTCASGRRDRASSSTEGSNNHSVYAGRAARLCHEVECGDPRPSSEGTRALIVRRRQVYHETKILLRWCEGLRPIAAKVSCDRRSSRGCTPFQVCAGAKTSISCVLDCAGVHNCRDVFPDRARGRGR